MHAQSEFIGTVDYVFASQTLTPLRVLDVPMPRPLQLPDAHVPSDHVPLIIELQMQIPAPHQPLRPSTPDHVPLIAELQMHAPLSPQQPMRPSPLPFATTPTAEPAAAAPAGLVRIKGGDALRLPDRRPKPSERARTARAVSKPKRARAGAGARKGKGQGMPQRDRLLLRRLSATAFLARARPTQLRLPAEQ
jgi:hypothetical protein